MGTYIAQQTIKQMIKAGKVIEGANVFVLGLTFKENVPDFRDSRVTDIISELKTYGVNVFAHDPFIRNSEEIAADFDAQIISFQKAKDMDAIVLATPHDQFRQRSLGDYLRLCRKSNGRPVFVDVKWVFKASEAESVGFNYWRV